QRHLPHRSTLFPYTTLFRSAASKTIGREGSPAYHRTGVIPASKKTSLNAGPPPGTPPAGMLRERYEQIRQRALERTAMAIGSGGDRKSTRLNSSHSQISYAV